MPSSRSRLMPGACILALGFRPLLAFRFGLGDPVGVRASAPARIRQPSQEIEDKLPGRRGRVHIHVENHEAKPFSSPGKYCKGPQHCEPIDRGESQSTRHALAVIQRKHHGEMTAK
jgi:hypothetical protein